MSEKVLYTKDDVRVWGSLGGAVFYAPKGTPLPATFEEELNAAFIPVGILSEDGVSEGLSTDSNDIKGWPGGQLVRSTITSTEKTISFTMLEDSPLSHKLYYDASKPTTAGTGARIDLPEAVGTVEGTFIVVKVDGGVTQKRCLELCQVSERGDQEANNEDAAGKEITLKSVGKDYLLTNAPTFVEAIGK